jgi:serine/threonine-protein kinase
MPDDPQGKFGIAPGDVLAGKYRVDRILGAGGMGVVVAAHHLKLDQRVAIKLLLPEALDDTEATTRFEREARAAAKIKSQHIAKVTDVGTLENGSPYIVMEYLEGEDLASRLERSGGFPIPDAVDIVLQACEVLAEAHALGIVHRDLKPANLFCVSEDGLVGGRTSPADGNISIKVLDFGISKIADRAGSAANMSITKTSAVMGSPAYMSPEQMQTPRDVDGRTDIWSLGIILFELLVGKVPFDGETLPEVCVKVATLPVPSVRRFRLDTPPGLEVVVRQCLEKDRDRRFGSVAELARALALFAPERAQASLDRIARSAGRAETREARSNDHDDVEPQAPRNVAISWWRTGRWAAAPWVGWRGTSGMLVAGTLGLTGVAFVAIGLSSSHTATSPAETPSAQPPPKAARIEEPSATKASPSSTFRPFIVPSELPLAPDPPSQPTRTATRSEAGKTATGESAQTCILNLNSIPVATVVLDGERLGATPKIGFATSAGTHVVTFEHLEYDLVTRTVTCGPGETKAVGVRLSHAITTPSGEPDIEANPYR